MDKKTSFDQSGLNDDLKKILTEIEAFEQFQTADRLRQWLENPVRLPREDSTYPKNKKSRKSGRR